MVNIGLKDEPQKRGENYVLRFQVVGLDAPVDVTDRLASTGYLFKWRAAFAESGEPLESNDIQWTKPGEGQPAFAVGRDKPVREGDVVVVSVEVRDLRTGERRTYKAAWPGGGKALVKDEELERLTSKRGKIPAMPNFDIKDGEAILTAVRAWSRRAAKQAVPDSPYMRLWTKIQETSDMLSYGRYKEFVDELLCKGNDFTIDGNTVTVAEIGDFKAALNKLAAGDRTDAVGDRAFDVLRYATEAFLLKYAQLDLSVAGTDLPGAEANNPFYTTLREIGDSDFCKDAESANNRRRFFCVELIWSYFHEVAGLVQSWKAICLRYQNRRSRTLRDPLVALETHPLRPLSSLIWGYIRAERELLTPQRRNLEYQYAYGIGLWGGAVSGEEPVVQRSKFIATFNSLINVVTRYYRDEQDLNVVADGFPVLQALRELRGQLVDGMHNQYGQLPWQAKVEMLMLKWLMSRQEVKTFLPSKPITLSGEPWMESVDAMRRLQGWGDTPSRVFARVADIAERLLLSVRFGPWGSQDAGLDNEANAKSWADSFRDDVREYVHIYRVITAGVDLSAHGVIDATPPSVYLQRQLALSQRV